MSPDSRAIIETAVRLPLADGRRLHGRLWRPAAGGPVPAILEIAPYRFGDIMRLAIEASAPWWAARGYAVLALDTAGAGGSDGLLHDEYLPGEIEDAEAAIAWCASQPWCDGKVGMTGFSWSAFTALRVAVRRPPALAALVLGGVSEDGWVTDIHNLGGTPFAAEVDWAGTMLMFNALPPDPAQMGPGWRETWRRRLAANRPWIIPWRSHPARDAWWAAKAADPAQGAAPLLLYAGLADKYAAAVPRIAGAWGGAVRSILGPWAHRHPHQSEREPRIGFLQEALRWWDRWLKGIDTGVEGDPPLRLWLGRPDRAGRTTEGRWIGGAWPADAEGGGLWADGDRLAAEPHAGSPDATIALTPAPRTPAALGSDLYEDEPAPFDLAVARSAGAWVGMAEPAMEDRDIVPWPALRFRLRQSPPSGRLVARLIDIAPDGAAVRMAIAAIDLAGRPAGSDLHMAFGAAAWTLAAGHRLALVLEASGWPTFWPDPRGGPIFIEAASVRLLFPPATSVGRTPVFAAAFVPPTSKVGKLKWIDPEAHRLPAPAVEGAAAWEARIAGHHLAVTGTDLFGLSRFELALRDGGREAEAAKHSRFVFRRPDWSALVRTGLSVRSRPGVYAIAWTVEAEADGEPVFTARQTADVPRPD